MKKCICASWNIDVTGHREDCPAKCTKAPMVRKAGQQDKLILAVQQLIRTVKAQEQRILQLEKLINLTESDN